MSEDNINLIASQMNDIKENLRELATSIKDISNNHNDVSKEQVRLETRYDIYKESMDAELAKNHDQHDWFYGKFREVEEKLGNEIARAEETHKALMSNVERMNNDLMMNRENDTRTKDKIDDTISKVDTKLEVFKADMNKKMYRIFGSIIGAMGSFILYTMRQAA